MAGSGLGRGKGEVIAPWSVQWSAAWPAPPPKRAMTRKQGIEVTLKMDNGELLAIVQEDGGENFAPGERVRLLESGGQTRVTH
jgi:outer membrane lipoprotein SlyB